MTVSITPPYFFSDPPPDDSEPDVPCTITGTLNEKLARAVCRVWNIDSDLIGYVGPNGRYVVGWKRNDVQKVVKAFIAMRDLES